MVTPSDPLWFPEQHISHDGITCTACKKSMEWMGLNRWHGPKWVHHADMCYSKTKCPHCGAENVWKDEDAKNQGGS